MYFIRSVFPRRNYFRLSLNCLLIVVFTIASLAVLSNVDIGSDTRNIFHQSDRINSSAQIQAIRVHRIVRSARDVFGTNKKRLYAYPYTLKHKKYKDENATKSFTIGDIKILMHDENLCKQPLDYLVYVHANPLHFKKRQVMRSTWANPKLFKNMTSRTVFLLGTTDDPELQEAINMEFESHGDTIQGDFKDNYKNLTLKGVMALQWITKYCPDVPFVLKADDDAFVNVFAMLDIAYSTKNVSRTMICGLSTGNMPILRDPKSCAKWCIKEDEFPGETDYPPYCSGLFYLIGTSVVKELGAVVHTTPFFWIDDVYITGLLPQKIDGNIDYRNLLRRVGLKTDLALANMLNRKEALRYDAIHAWNQNHMQDLWKALLKRLEPKYRSLVRPGVFATV